MVAAWFWIASLALFHYLQEIGLLYSTQGYDFSPETVGLVLNTSFLLWVLSLFPALCCSMAFLVYAWPRKQGEEETLITSRNLERANILGLLLISIFIYIFVYRLITIWTILGGVGWKHSTVFKNLHCFQGKVTEPFDRLIWIVLLTLIIVFLSSFSLLKRKTRFSLAVLAIYLTPVVLLGILTPLTFPNVLLRPVLHENVLRDISTNETWEKLLKYGKPTDDMGLKILRKYWLTLGPEGNYMPTMEVSRTWGNKRCTLCLPPVTGFFTYRGITIDLRQSNPVENEPDLIIEIIASGKVIKYYHPEEIPVIQEIGWEERMNIDPFPSWVILKADATLSYIRILETFDFLASRGATRVTLAALPVAFVDMPKHVPLVEITDHSDLQNFEPSSVQGGSIRIFVTKSGSCMEGDLLLLRRQEREKQFPSPGDVTNNVSIKVKSKFEYQSLIINLERAMVGGARHIVLLPAN
ncbi:MAG TPA: hypothetical protein PLD04_01835 [Thermoanaerobaculia bacterium]|mgnify:CR=1 FL=1|nr:hypothetical protein [Thermoanaerobaculia bacterium]HXK67057.1 hypothetical protein [Thermoanaerobaculia bacterium]